MKWVAVLIFTVALGIVPKRFAKRLKELEIEEEWKATRKHHY